MMIITSYHHKPKRPYKIVNSGGLAMVTRQNWYLPPGPKFFRVSCDRFNLRTKWTRRYESDSRRPIQKEIQFKRESPYPYLKYRYLSHSWLYLFIVTWILECCEKYKSFKLKIPQPDSERRHSPDFRTVFGIMIGPFSSCEIGKTWGTNKQVNKQTNKNWKFQFPQPDYRPRHSPDFRTVFGIMIGPFSSCEIGKTWGT